MKWIQKPPTTVPHAFNFFITGEYREPLFGEYFWGRCEEVWQRESPCYLGEDPRRWILIHVPPSVTQLMEPGEQVIAGPISWSNACTRFPGCYGIWYNESLKTWIRCYIKFEICTTGTAHNPTFVIKPAQ